jgi:predicted  nucleic acid-binding Zn-ribbon protein
MSDQPLTLAVLAQFHRQVILPDIERIVAATEHRLRDEVHVLQDFVLKRLDRLENEYEAIKAGLARIEGRLDVLEVKVAGIEAHILDLQAQVLELRTRLGRVEERLEELIAVEERYPVRQEVQDLKARIDRLQEDIRRLDQRLKG